MGLDISGFNSLWTSLLVEEFFRCRVRFFCSVPGSRSAWLVSAVARHPSVENFVHFDERALGFYAMGYIAATGKPAVVIVTSGTAAANLLPAVVEASRKKLPLILITADRPPELQKTGAMQTIDQAGLFGSFVRDVYHLPCPDISILPEYVLTTIDQVVFRAARGNLPGPVHINAMFRETYSSGTVSSLPDSYLKSLQKWRSSNQPYTIYSAAGSGESVSDSESIRQRFLLIENGIIVVGKIKGARDAEAVLTFAEKTGWPVYPDITSGLRMGIRHPLVCPYFDLALASPSFRAKLNPDGIIHFGGRMTSKRFYEFVSGLKNIEYISVLPHPLRSDPLHCVTARVVSSVSVFCDQMIPMIEKRGAAGSARLSCSVMPVIEEIVAQETEGQVMTGSAVAREVSSRIAATHALFLSNSMPVRDMDMVADFVGNNVPVGSNRGASGIDGIIASSIGYSRGMGCPVTLLIGDLAFLHDMNSLSFVKGCLNPLIIVLINNGGGGIFSHLPIAQEKDIFESSFVLAHQWTFKHAAQQFGLEYFAPENLPDFSRIYQRAVEHSQKSCLIECRTVRDQEWEWYKVLEKKIMERLNVLSG